MAAIALNKSNLNKAYPHITTNGQNGYMSLALLGGDAKS